MPEYLSISEIMQTAVTPVFLLAGIGALLNVMTGRLGRIIDRLRYLQSFLELILLENTLGKYIPRKYEYLTDFHYT